MKNIKIAIHERKGSYSDRWIEFCKKNDIEYVLISCFHDNVIAKLKMVDGLLWHWSPLDATSSIVAKSIISCVEGMGLAVFPNIKTCWHYDDKIAQKYLFESINAPSVPTYVFFNEAEAMTWINQAIFPKVFKLRCGAGSQNVRLVKSRRNAITLCKKAFGQGFNATAGYRDFFHEGIQKSKTFNKFIEKTTRLPKTLLSLHRRRISLPLERNYIYFQDYFSNNQFDTRITVIGDRAFGFIRYVRPNDFRASGSGNISYDIKLIDPRCLQVAFETTKKIGAQSLAFDFIFDDNHYPRITEISYCYRADAIYNCPGYWDREFSWRQGHFWPEEIIIQDLLFKIKGLY